MGKFTFPVDTESEVFCLEIAKTMVLYFQYLRQNGVTFSTPDTVTARSKAQVQSSNLAVEAPPEVTFPPG